jgi:hypothetical protein
MGCQYFFPLTSWKGLKMKPFPSCLQESKPGFQTEKVRAGDMVFDELKTLRVDLKEADQFPQAPLQGGVPGPRS